MQTHILHKLQTIICCVDIFCCYYFIICWYILTIQIIVWSLYNNYSYVCIWSPPYTNKFKYDIWKYYHASPSDIYFKLRKNVLCFIWIYSSRRDVYHLVFLRGFESIKHSIPNLWLYVEFINNISFYFYLRFIKPIFPGIHLILLD